MSFWKVHKKYLETSGLIWAICLVAFLISYVGVLGPQKEYKDSIERDLAEKKQVYESALGAAKEEIIVKRDAEIEELRNKLGDFAIDFEDSANLTFDISQVASEKKVSSFSIKSKDGRGITNIPDCKYIGESHIEIEFVGNFHQFALFLNALERHRPVLFVKKFTITKPRQSDSDCQVSLNVAVLVKRPQGGKGAAKQKQSTEVYGQMI